MINMIVNELRQFFKGLLTLPQTVQAPHPFNPYAGTLIGKPTQPKPYQRIDLELSQTDKHFLNKGHAVYVHSHEQDQKVWLYKPEENSHHLATRQGLLCPHYDYNLYEVLAQLPLTAKSENDLRKLEGQIQNGVNCKTEMILDGQPVQVNILADPLNRSIKVTHPTRGTLTCDDMGITLQPPLKVDHYAVYKDGYLIGTSHFLVTAMDYPKRKMIECAERDKDCHFSIYAIVTPGIPPSDEKRITGEHIQLAMSTCTIDTPRGKSITILRAQRPGDLETAQESAFRNAISNKIHMTHKEYITAEIVEAQKNKLQQKTERQPKPVQSCKQRP